MKKLWHLFLHLNRGKQIAISVLFFHFAALLGMLGQYGFAKKKPTHHRIAVHTITPLPPTAPVKKAQQTVTPLPPKKVAKPSAPPAKKVNPKKEVRSEKTVKTLEAPPQSIDVKPAPRSELLIPSLAPVQAVVTSEESLEDFPSEEKIIALLQSSLQLPEYGDVVMKLTIDSSGILIACEILEEHSKKNSEFLKKELPQLFFPFLPDTTSFTIKFRNLEQP